MMSRLIALLLALSLVLVVTTTAVSAKTNKHARKHQKDVQKQQQQVYHPLPDSMLDVIVALADIKKVEKDQKSSSKNPNKKRNQPSTVFFDIGCGTGEVAVAIATRSDAKQVICIEGDKTNLDKAKALAKDHNVASGKITFINEHPSSYEDGGGSIDFGEYGKSTVAFVHNIPRDKMSLLGATLFTNLEPGTQIITLHKGWPQYPPYMTFALDPDTIPAELKGPGGEFGYHFHRVSKNQRSELSHDIGLSTRIDVPDFGDAVHKYGELAIHKLLSTEIEQGRVYMGTMSQEKEALAHRLARERKVRERKNTRRLVYSAEKNKNVDEESVESLVSKQDGSTKGILLSEKQKQQDLEQLLADQALDHLFISAVIGMSKNVTAIRFQQSDGLAKLEDQQPDLEMRVADVKRNIWLSGWASNRGPLPASGRKQDRARYSTFALGKGGERGAPVPTQLEIQIRFMKEPEQEKQQQQQPAPDAAAKNGDL